MTIWKLCSAQANKDPIPIMRMYFHSGQLDYILFKEWVPTSTGILLSFSSFPLMISSCLSLLSPLSFLLSLLL